MPILGRYARTELVCPIPDATAVDGLILDPGGPARPGVPSVPALSPLALWLLVGSLLLGAGLRRRPLSAQSVRRPD